MLTSVAGEPENEPAKFTADDAKEQVYLAYIKRWRDRGRKTSPLGRDQVLQLFGDFPFASTTGKIAINQLLEIE